MKQFLIYNQSESLTRPFNVRLHEYVIRLQRLSHIYLLLSYKTHWCNKFCWWKESKKNKQTKCHFFLEQDSKASSSDSDKDKKKKKKKDKKKKKKKDQKKVEALSCFWKNLTPLNDLVFRTGWWSSDSYFVSSHFKASFFGTLCIKYKLFSNAPR